MNNYNNNYPEPDKNPKTEPTKPEPSHNQGDAYKGNDGKETNIKGKE